ncbi:hypothetical protein BREV_BREV_01283 [Brevundimonas mediterranea]|uniref:Uncharacterized protein n=1 Tax=Brevundimonas mediterranea TaxID=74329 RepID=A0A7Z8Y2H6_9CAUL|nr:hypothetical protein BREV_BREV_01283 [Brevundimonas mediterranea]
MDDDPLMRVQSADGRWMIDDDQLAFRWRCLLLALSAAILKGHAGCRSHVAQV